MEINAKINSILDVIIKHCHACQRDAVRKMQSQTLCQNTANTEGRFIKKVSGNHAVLHGQTNQLS